MIQQCRYEILSQDNKQIAVFSVQVTLLFIHSTHTINLNQACLISKFTSPHSFLPALPTQWEKGMARNKTIRIRYVIKLSKKREPYLNAIRRILEPGTH